MIMSTDAMPVRAARWLDALLLACMPAVYGLLVLMVGATAWLALDREPPFVLIAFDEPPPRVQAGGVVTIRAAVRREVWRGCSVTLTNRMHFAGGARWDMGERRFSAEELADQERRTPGRLAVVNDVPAWAPPGPAVLVSTRYYACGNNPTHWFAPIEVMTAAPFEVLPRAAGQ